MLENENTHPFLLDPATGEPLKALGMTSRGPIWPQIGAAEETGETTETNENTEQKPTETNENSNESDFDSLPKWAQDEIKKHRAGEKKARQERSAKEKELADARAENERNEKIRQTLVEAGLLEADDHKAEKLNADQLKSAQLEAAQSKIELAVLRSANKFEADADSLLDSRSFMKTVGHLDPKSDDFLSDIEDAVKEALDTNDRLKKTPTKKQPEKRSGGDHSAGGAAQRQLTEADLANMTPSEIAEAHSKGLLKKLMGIDS